MSNAIKQFVTESVSEEIDKHGARAYVTPLFDTLVESVSDRVADFVEGKAKEVIDKVDEEYGRDYAETGREILVDLGLITEPEPEPEPVDDFGVSEEFDNAEAPAWAQKLIERVASLEGIAKAAQQRGLL